MTKIPGRMVLGTFWYGNFCGAHCGGGEGTGVRLHKWIVRCLALWVLLLSWKHGVPNKFPHFPLHVAAVYINFESFNCLKYGTKSLMCLIFVGTFRGGGVDYHGTKYDIELNLKMVHFTGTQINQKNSNKDGSTSSNKIGAWGFEKWHFVFSSGSCLCAYQQC